MDNLVEIFVSVDEFCKIFIPEWNKRLIANGEKKRCRASRLSFSEIITILIMFQQSKYRNFKAFYIENSKINLKKEFPNLLSYNRFVELIPRVTVPLCAYLQSRRKASEGIAFIDSTSVVVCHNKRIRAHKVFKGLAKRGKSTMGWFYGFKLHLVCNHNGELVSCQITPGNVDDKKTAPKLTDGLSGKLFADKGYISQVLFEKLFAKGLQLVTGLKKNMKNKLLSLFDKIMLLKRAVIESVNNQLKNVLHLDHTKHRSPINGFANMLAALAAYAHYPNKPSIGLTKNELKLIAQFM